MKPAFLTALLLFGCTAVQSFGEAWELFEDPEVPSGWTLGGGEGRIQIVDTESIQGDRSLRWEWEEPGTILSWDLNPVSEGTGHRVFSQWVRQETPLPQARLRVELRSTSGDTRFFEMNLDFTGWRTVFVPYSSMNGGGASSVDRVRWTIVGIPPTAGELHLDQVIVGQGMDVRFQYADRQAPFVWAERANSMWENHVHWYRATPGPAAATEAEIAAARELRARWDARLIGSGTVTGTMVDQWEAGLSEFNVRREGGRVRGNQIYYRQYPGYAYPSRIQEELANAEGKHDFQEFTTLMLTAARGWHRTNDAGLRERIANMLVLMAEHLLDQGWAAGSNQGCLFLYGYQAREYMRAMYLARDVYAEAGLLGEMGEAARWYGQAGSLLDEDRAPNMDFFNTLLQGQMLSLLMEPDEDVQVAWLRAFSRSISRQIADHRPGDVNGFKPDGTAFHHNGHYPAYAIGAISTLGQIFDVLHGTPFEPDDAGRMAFREVLLAARAYSQLHDWPVGVGGRHPFSGNIGAARGAFAALAKYPDPVEGAAPDREIASAYVRLWGEPSGELADLFDTAGIRAENLSGFFSFPFANHAVYRDGDWMVSLKGYSRYVWSSEIYANDNRYGRNQSNGTAEILLGGGRVASGFREEGWDWNRLPGTTALHLPLDELESPRAGTLMLRSNETMAGSVAASGEGAFGFILNESYFGHLLQARKSYFAADGMLVALGSGILSDHSTAPVETTLFQVALDSSRPPTILSSPSGTTVGALPWTMSESLTESFWVMDPVGNGFWIPPGQELRLSRLSQESRHNKTRAATTGDFAAGWLHHGVGASGEEYQYVILPQASVSLMEQFAQRMASADPAYEVLRQDDALHAVRFPGPERYGYVFFEAGRWEDLPYLIEADAPSLVWVEEGEEELWVALSNPDLNPGEAENLVSPTGFLLRGLWAPANNQQDEWLLWHENGNTRLVVPALEGATIPLRLTAVAEERTWTALPERNELSAAGNFHLVFPNAPLLGWDAADPSIYGYVVERMYPPDGDFLPIAFLGSDVSQFIDESLPPETLVYYRLRKWDGDGLGLPTSSLLVLDGGTESFRWDFGSMSDVAELEQQGWSSSGIQSAGDWYLAAQGMFLIDNHPSLPASLTVPFARSSTGSVAARMGVARMANFNARIELMAGERSIATIQMTSRTTGFLRGAGDVEFSDERWDVEQGTLRNVSIEWRPVPGTDQMAIVLRYGGTSDGASAVNRWKIGDTGANRPDSLRLSVGFGSAVNRGMVIESLDIFTTTPVALKDFYQEWAEVVLGSGAASPSADASGNGIANFWEFTWARNTPDLRRVTHPDLSPRVRETGSGATFLWEVPAFDDIRYLVESAAQLDEPWFVSPHWEVPLAGSPGWMEVVAPALDLGRPRGFYRLVLAYEFD